MVSVTEAQAAPGRGRAGFESADPGWPKARQAHLRPGWAGNPAGAGVAVALSVAARHKLQRRQQERTPAGRQVPGHRRFSAFQCRVSPVLAAAGTIGSDTTALVPDRPRGSLTIEGKMLMPFFIDAEEAGGRDRRPTRPS